MNVGLSHLPDTVFSINDLVISLVSAYTSTKKKATTNQSRESRSSTAIETSVQRIKIIFLQTFACSN